MNFERDACDWPNRAASHRVRAGGLVWHVQVLGEGPVLLLLHGTGSSTHSWRHLMQLLAPKFKIVAPDLPGHAFTQAPSHESGFTLPGMAQAVEELLQVMHLAPVIVAGHSAGAAIGMRAALDGGLAPRALISLNGALFPFGGAAGALFAPLAKMLVTLPMVAKLMSWRAKSRNAVARLLADIGSQLQPEDIEYYARLFRDEAHVAATLAMMANWDLVPLVRESPALKAPLTLVAGANDKAVPPGDAKRMAQLVKGAEVVLIEGTGHLSHEEKPQAVAAVFERVARQSSVLT